MVAILVGFQMIVTKAIAVALIIQIQETKMIGF